MAEAKANPKPAAYNTNWWPNQLRVDLLSGVSVRRATSARLAAQIPDFNPAVVQPDKPGFDYNTAFARSPACRAQGHHRDP